MSELLSYLYSLAPLTKSTAQALRALFSPRTLDKGECFIAAGEVAATIAFLEEGVVRAYHRSSKGVEYNKHFFQSPCLMGGYASLITKRPNQITQQALSPCSIWVADYAQLVALYNTHPDLERVARVLAEQFFVQKEQREVELVLLNADQRYAIFQRDFPDLEQRISQYHIASYLGITPTQLSRIRRKMLRS